MTADVYTRKGQDTPNSNVGKLFAHVLKMQFKIGTVVHSGPNMGHSTASLVVSRASTRAALLSEVFLQAANNGEQLLRAVNQNVAPNLLALAAHG